MDWVILVVSGAMEAVWAQALDRSEGFTQPIPTIVFIAALAVSMLGLSHAVRTIPLGTAYAVWVGIGAVCTLIMGILIFDDSASWLRIIFVLLVIAGIAGIHVTAGGA